MTSQNTKTATQPTAPNTPNNTATISITTLEPKKLWQWFDVICRIPHPSYKETALAQHILTWAKDKGFEAYRDDVGNVIIKKPATLGRQNHKPIALQAHLDMVCQANHDYDFDHLPIEPIIDGDWVRAKQTTLGADNGIGLASILAVLDSDDIAHPPLEALLTVNEEAGMDGVMGLRDGLIDAELMINTDTEAVGEIYIGCAGGVDAEISLPIKREPVAGQLLSVRVLGLKGGHSGLDIHKNNSNAILLLADLLSDLPIRLVALQGGTARNAIPRTADAVIACDEADLDDVLQTLNARANKLTTLIGTYETQADFVVERWGVDVPSANQGANSANQGASDGANTKSPTTMLNLSDTQKVIALLNAMPNGVLRYSDKVADTVETSLSLGTVVLQDSQVALVSLIRSLNETGKQHACRKVQSVANLAGAKVDFVGSYMGWEPNPSSPITALTAQVYEQVIGDVPQIKVIHAGLECGLIQNVYPKMDIVSIGPTIKNAHSPDECVYVPSVATYWQVLLGVLASIPAKI